MYSMEKQIVRKTSRSTFVETSCKSDTLNSLVYSLNIYKHSVGVGRIIIYRTVYNLWLQPGSGPLRLDTPVVVISLADPVVVISVVITVYIPTHIAYSVQNSQNKLHI